MHPGRCAEISVFGQAIGYVAEVDPDAVQKYLDIPHTLGRIAVFEWDTDVLLSFVSDQRRFQPLPRFPAVSRDLNVVVAEEIPYALLQQIAVSTADSALLEDVALQTIYRGQPIAEGNKAVALRINFRAQDRTLTDSEVEGQMAAVEEQMFSQAKARRR